MIEYHLAYYANFKSRYNIPYTIEIRTKESVSAPEELILSSTPFVAEWEADSLFKPLKMSNAVCQILTKKMLFGLYIGDAQGVKIVLINNSDNKVEWVGYVSPNLYSSDYISVDTVDIEAVDTIACLENIKYSYIGGKAEFRSFYDIIVHILDKADPLKSVDVLRVQNCNKVASSKSNCVLEDLYVNERNFFDEMGEPMTCKDVLSSLVGYLGMTMFQWRNTYYIVDYEYINNEHDECYRYHRAVPSLNEKSYLGMIHKNIKDIGISGSNGSVSLDNVFNKVSVVASTNAIDDLCPELFDDEDLVNQNADPNKYYEETIGENVFLSAYFKSKENWETYYSGIEIPEITPSNINGIFDCSFFQKTDSYNLKSGEPSSLNWEAALTFYRNSLPDINGGYLSMKERYTPFLKLNKKNISLLPGGYIIVDFRYKLSQHYISSDGYESPSKNALYVSNDNNKYSSGYEDTKYYCRLRIGDYYYDGERWNLYSDYLSNKEYYETVVGTTSISGKLQYYKINSSGDRVEITKTEYDKIIAGDKFLIVRKNNENDKIYDTWYSPTNQVSYKYNLSDAIDGVLIKLPNFLLYGEITFELCPPTILGGMPCYLTTGDGSGYCRYCHLKDLTLKYTNKKYVYDVFGNKLNDAEDIVYSNVINDNYVTEAEDVELLVNSYAENALSYSNVATKKEGKYDYLKSVFSPLENEYYLPEQLLIDKLYRHHRSPKVIYRNSLKYYLSPLDVINENSLNKSMVVNALGVDYANDSADVTLIEV